MDAATQSLVQRRDRRLGTILRFVTPAALVGALSAVPALWLEEPTRTVGAISMVSLLCLAVAYMAAWGLLRWRRPDLARAVLFLSWLVYEAEQLLLYRPDFDDPIIGTLYVAIGTAYTAMLVVGVSALEVYPRALRWIVAILATYLTCAAVLTVWYAESAFDARMFATVFGMSWLLLVCLAGFTWAFTTDLSELLATAEAQRTREVALRAQLQVALDLSHTASATKSQFLANMSHELRTPLAGIIGYAELVQEELEEIDHAELSPDVERIADAARHLRVIIDAVLDLSKIEAGKLEVLRERVELRKVLDEVLATSMPLAQSGVWLHVAHDPSTTHVLADRVRLQQVLLNLVSNEVGPTDEGDVRVAVRDTGIGIDPDQLDRVFRPFEQADGSTTRSYGGTGLGLAISARLVELMGGELTAESRPGRGSTFWFTLAAGRSGPVSRDWEGAAVAG